MKQFNPNVVGLILDTQRGLRLMSSEGGTIISIGSIVGSMPAPQATAYSVTKAAVDTISVSLSQELGPRKIRVNSLNPGMVETECLHASGLNERAFREQWDSKTPLGRFGQPDDIAPM
jgi:3-oxoacyl-[acyl-carrier protein] reductase